MPTTYYELRECELVAGLLRVGEPLRVTEYDSAFEMGRAAAALPHEDDVGWHFAAVEGREQRSLTPKEQAAVEAGMEQEGAVTRKLGEGKVGD